METLFSKKVPLTQIPIPNVLSNKQPREFLMDSIIEPSVIPIDQSLQQSPTPYLQNPMVFEPLMANQPSSIVGGMFSPEISRAAEMEYLQKRQAAMRDRALAFAQLTPMQQADYGFYRGGQQLGDVVGGALGGQDPQLKMIGLQQQILSELDPSDPQQQLRVAQKYARVAPELAIKIADSARKSLSEIALATQRNREKQGADPFEQLLRTGKYTTASMAAYKLSGNVADLREVENPEKIPAKILEGKQLAISKGFPEGTPQHNEIVANYIEGKERLPSVGSDREAFAKAEFGKNFYDLNQDQQKIINKLVDEEKQRIAKAGAMVVPGQPIPPKDWLAFSSQISKDPVMERTSTILADAPSAIETIRMSATNDIAAASLPGSLARLTGEGKNMSNQDVNRFARTGGLDDRLAQDAVGFFTGRKTNVTKEQAERFAIAVYRGALLERKKFIKDQAEQAGYDKTPNYDIAIRQLDDQLAKFKLITPKDKSAPAPKLDADSLVKKYLQPK